MTMFLIGPTPPLLFINDRPEYAVKIVSTKKITELGYERSINREIAILRTMSHPGIARLISTFRFRDGAYLVLEYASGGDLHTLLKRNGSLDHTSTQFVIGEIVAALSSIHDAGYVFGDLKVSVQEQINIRTMKVPFSITHIFLYKLTFSTPEK